MASGFFAILDDVAYPGDFPTFATPAPPTDSDNDGIADTWETTTWGSTTPAASGDEDGDGYTNIEEYLHYLSISSFTENADCMQGYAVPQAPSNLKIK